MPNIPAIHSIQGFLVYRDPGGALTLCIHSFTLGGGDNMGNINYERPVVNNYNLETSNAINCTAKPDYVFTVDYHHLLLNMTINPP